MSRRARLRDATFLLQPHILLEQRYVRRRVDFTILGCSSLGLDRMESTENTLPSSASQDTKQANSDGEEGQYAFLVHSQDSVSQNTPPDVDNQRLARQKRRRTRYILYNIGPDIPCLLIASTAPKITPSLKPNMKRTPNLTRQQGSKL